MRFGALTKPQKVQVWTLYTTSMLTALFATCKGITMKTFYFVSFDGGFLQFSTITVEQYVSADVAHYMLVQECPIMWIAVSREEYVQLRNE